MPIEDYGLREMIIAATSDVITAYLHTGDPGTQGTANRVPSSTLGSVDIPAGTTGWNIHASEGSATAANNLDFGNAGAAVTAISWYSLFKGGNFYARRVFAAARTIGNGDPVVFTGSSITLEVTSVDT